MDAEKRRPASHGPTPQPPPAAKQSEAHPHRSALHRRASAAWRCAPLITGRAGHLVARDPWAVDLCSGPGTYGLSPEQLWREATRLHRLGWGIDEIGQVLAVPRPPGATG